MSTTKDLKHGLVLALPSRHSLNSYVLHSPWRLASDTPTKDLKQESVVAPCIILDRSHGPSFTHFFYPSLIRSLPSPQRTLFHIITALSTEKHSYKVPSLSSLRLFPPLYLPWIGAFGYKLLFTQHATAHLPFQMGHSVPLP
ncbi:hypothetical protein MUK42_36918 [Musa troglodytarum]|uniref:Uncharacterized protein n=1 Tax=Musa troglodytarum TaxID=320322 RepID=A0A9E7G965_9LILI|nr:hypothetical protein MUK42_36918 [Musa troglodytarum]